MEEKSVNRYYVLPEGSSIEDYFGGEGKIDDAGLAECYNKAESFTEESLPPSEGNVLIFTLDKKKKEIVLEFLIDAKQGTSSDFKSTDEISAKRTFKASLVKQKKEKKKGLGRLSGLLRRGSRSRSGSDSGLSSDGSDTRSRSGSTSSMSSAGSDDRSRSGSTSSQDVRQATQYATVDMAQIAARAAKEARSKREGDEPEYAALGPGASKRPAVSESDYAGLTPKGESIYVEMAPNVYPFARLGKDGSHRKAVSESYYAAFDSSTRTGAVDPELQKELESQYFSDLKREMWAFVDPELNSEKDTSQTRDLELIQEKFNKRFKTDINNPSDFDSLNMRDFFQSDHIKTAINEKAAQMIQSKEDVIKIIKTNPKIYEEEKPIDATKEMAYEIAETVNAVGLDVARINDKDGQNLDNIIDDIKYLVEKNIYLRQKVAGSIDLFELELKNIIDNAKPDIKEAEFSKLKAKYAIEADIKLDEYFAVGEDDELTETKEKIMDSLSAQIEEEVDKKYNYKKFISDGRFPKGLVPGTSEANVASDDKGTYAVPKKDEGGSNLPGQGGGAIEGSAQPAKPVYMPMRQRGGAASEESGQGAVDDHVYDQTHVHLRAGGEMGGEAHKIRPPAPLPKGARPPAPLPPGARPPADKHYATASAIVRVENPEIELELRSEHFSQLKQEMWKYLEGELKNLRLANVRALDEEKFIPLQGRFNKKFGTNIDNLLAFDATSLEDFFADRKVMKSSCLTSIQKRQRKLVSKEQEEIIAILKKYPSIFEENFEPDAKEMGAKNIAQIVKDFGLDYSKINYPNDPQYQSIIDRIKFEVEKQVLLYEKNEAYTKLFELELKELIEKGELDKEQEALKARYGIDFEVDLNSYYSEDGNITEVQDRIQGHLCDVLASNEIDKKYKPKENMYDIVEVGLEPTLTDTPGYGDFTNASASSAFQGDTKPEMQSPEEKPYAAARSAAPAGPGQGVPVDSEEEYVHVSDQPGFEHYAASNPLKRTPEEQTYDELPGQRVPVDSEEEYVHVSDQPGFEHYADSNPSQRTLEGQTYGELPGQGGVANLTNASASSADQGEDLQDIIKGSWKDVKRLYKDNLRERFFETVMHHIQDIFDNIEEHPESLEEIANFVGLQKSDLENAKGWPDVETKIMPTIESKAVEILGKDLPAPPRPAKDGKKTKMQAPEKKPYAAARSAASEESIYDLGEATSPNFESMAKFYWKEIQNQEIYKTGKDKRKDLFEIIKRDLSANLTLDDVKIKDFYNLPDNISTADLKEFESNPEIMNKFTVHIDKVLSETLDNYPKGHSVESQQVYAEMNPGVFIAEAAAAGARAAASISPDDGDSTKLSLSSKDAFKTLREARAPYPQSDKGASSSAPLSSADVKKAAAAFKVGRPEVKPKSLKPEVAKNNKKIELYEKRVDKINESINAAEDIDKISSLEEQLMVLYLEQEKLLNENIIQETDLIRKKEYQEKAKQVRKHYEGYLEAYISTDTEKAAMVSAFSDKREEKEIQESILKLKAQRENYFNISPKKNTEIYSEKTLEKIIEIDHKIQAELISLEAKDAKNAAEFVKENGLEHQSAKAKIYATSIPKVLEEKSINPVVKAEMERLIPGMRTYLGEELYYEDVAPSTQSEEFKKEFGMDISEDEFRNAKYDVEKFLSSKVFLDSLKKKAGENIEKSSEIELSNLLKDLRKAPKERNYLDQIASKYMLKDIPLDELAKYDGKSSPIHQHLKERVAYAAISRESLKKEPHKMWNELFNEIYKATDVQEEEARKNLLDKIDLKYELGMTPSEIEEMIKDSEVSEKIQKRAYDSIKTTCQIKAEKSMPEFENSTSELWKGDIGKRQRQPFIEDLIAKVKNVSQMQHVLGTPKDIRIEAERKILNQVSNAFRILQSRGATPEELKELNKNINLERGKIDAKANIDRENVIELELQLNALEPTKVLTKGERNALSKRLIKEAQEKAAKGAEKRAAEKAKREASEGNKGPLVAPKPKTKTASAAGS